MILSTRRLSVVTLGAVMAALTILTTPESGQGQILRGVVVEAESRSPLTAVLVTLVDEGGRDRQRYLVDADGVFRFTLPSSGRYSLRAERMGTASRTLEGFDVGPSDTVVVRIPLALEPVALEGIDVSAERRCELAVDAVVEIQRVWEEARKALNAASLTDSVGTYRYDLRRHVRELDGRTLLVRGESPSRQTVVSRSPIGSRPASQLMDEGFVVQDGEDRVYMAPDADVLLSEAFLDSHCFTLRSGEGEQRGMVGLEFRPHADLRGRTDIAGVLWISPRDGALDVLEFRYVNPSDPALQVATDLAGGRIQFRRMPDGSWIVSDWYIRMPLVEQERDGVFRLPRPALVGIIEEGGQVERALHVGSDMAVYAARAGSVTGQVNLSGDSGGPGSVVVLGLGAQSPVDAEGRFLLENIPSGRYELAYTRPNLMGLDRGPDRWLKVGEAVVEEGRRASVTLNPPPPQTLLARVCGVDPDQWDPEEAVLRGEVLDPESGIAVTDAVVEAAWQRVLIWDPLSDEFMVVANEGTRGSRTDEVGSFLLCGVPTDRTLTVRAYAGTASQEVTVIIPDGRPVGHAVVPLRSSHMDSKRN